MLFLTFGIGFLPPFAQITEIGMRVLGVFVGMLYGWIFIDLLWPSLFGFVTLGLTGFMTISETFSNGFGNPTFITCIICALFAATLSEIGVSDNIAHWLLSKRIFIGKPWLLISSICICSALMGIANGGTAAIFLLWSIIGSICEISGYSSQSKISNMMIAFVVYIVIAAQGTIPFYPGPVLFGSYLTRGTGLTLPNNAFIIVSISYVVLSTLGLILIAKFILKVDAQKFSTTEELCRRFSQEKSSIYQKAGLISLLLFFIVIVLPGLLPFFPYQVQLQNIGMVGMAILYITIFCVWKRPDGLPVLNLEVCFKKLPWAVIVLLAITTPLANAMESSETGITESINSALLPIFTHLSATQLVFLMMLLLGILTQFLNNIVLGTIFIPIIAPLIIEMGGNPYTAFFMLYFTLLCSYVSPAGSMMGGLIFGNDSIIKKNAITFGIVFLLVNYISLIILFPLCNLLFK